MLVKDEKSTTSAATVYVRSGSLNDPPEVNGLAHFCEHMLFLGSDKYPDDNHYAAHLTKSGGSRNAATAEDYTFFYFDVKNDYLGSTLDIFSQFFKKPHFNENSVAREM